MSNEDQAELDAFRGARITRDTGCRVGSHAFTWTTAYRRHAIGAVYLSRRFQVAPEGNTLRAPVIRQEDRKPPAETAPAAHYAPSWPASTPAMGVVTSNGTGKVMSDGDEWLTPAEIA